MRGVITGSFGENELVRARQPKAVFLAAMDEDDLLGLPQQLLDRDAAQWRAGWPWNQRVWSVVHDGLLRRRPGMVIGVLICQMKIIIIYYIPTIGRRRASAAPA